MSLLHNYNYRKVYKFPYPKISKMKTLSDKIKNKITTLGLIGVLGATGLATSGCIPMIIGGEIYGSHVEQQLSEHYKNKIVWKCGGGGCWYNYIDKNGNVKDVEKEDGKFCYKESGEKHCLDPIKDNIEVVEYK